MTQVYRFSQHATDGRGDMKEILGGKGAGLAEMCRLGVPVPPGFTISTQACIEYLESGGVLSEQLKTSVLEMTQWLEDELGKSLTQTDRPPLLLSVRSGGRVSMPGMMDTILNLGLNDEAVERLAALSGDRRFAFDSYRRFIQMYSNVVLELEHHDFERLLDDVREQEAVQVDSEISVEGLVRLVAKYKAHVLEELGRPFPTDPMVQLWGAICAVIDSWNNARARFYRKIHHIDDSWGTGVTVQSMVFGNMGMASGTGVCFSRNPASGEPGPYGEFLRNAQGEDVVAGIRTPQKVNAPNDASSMSAQLPELYNQLVETLVLLENHYKEMQDTEFTFENGQLFLLQTRTGKRTSQASLRIAIDMCKQGLIDEKEAIRRIDPNSMSQLLASEFDQVAKNQILESGHLLGRGLNAGPGAASGRLALSADLAAEWGAQGQSVILVRAETSPEDIEGMHSSKGILTQRGGMTSHAAVVARGMGKPCVVGCGEMKVDEKAGTISFGDRVLKEGDFLSIDGTTGEIINGEIPTEESKLIRQLKEKDLSSGDQGQQFSLLMSWVDRFTRMKVRANADTAQDARMALNFMAEGIGLCRTEHMFFEGDRIQPMREMILAETPEEREAALEKLLPYQRDDFIGLFEAMKGLPVTIRLLDPPLHEFLPNDAASQISVADKMGVPVEKIRERVERLHEINPMMGHRGCRVAVSFPEILKMQTRAITEAAIECAKRKVRAVPELMIPLVSLRSELAKLRGLCEEAIRETRQAQDFAGRVEIKIGTMIEIPRAAITADEIAEVADFFSFGTNALTQLVFGFSRDDVGSFLPAYLTQELIPVDPFQSLDRTGVGRLVEMGVELGRQTNEGIKLGICGEHGGDPASVHFCHRVGLDYVSCSPFRVPIARLAAAQAAIMYKN